MQHAVQLLMPLALLYVSQVPRGAAALQRARAHHAQTASRQQPRKLMWALACREGPQAGIMPGCSNAQGCEEDGGGCHRDDPHKIQGLGLVGEVQDAVLPLRLGVQQQRVLHQADENRGAQHQ